MAGIDENTKLILHCNGVDESTDFPDSSDSEHVVTAHGDAQIDTDITDPWGGNDGVAKFDGTGDYLSIPDSSDWAFGMSAFTIDFWVRFTYLPVECKFFSQRTTPIASNSNYLYWNNNTFSVATYSDGWTPGLSFNASWTPTIETWYHVALVRVDTSNSASGWRLFVNGQALSLTLVGGAWNNAWVDLGADFIIGGQQGQQCVPGYIDEFRISNVARWTLNFTPPTEPYTEEYGIITSSQAIIIF